MSLIPRVFPDKGRTWSRSARCAATTAASSSSRTHAWTTGSQSSMALAQRRTAARWGSVAYMSALLSTGLVAGGEAPTARPPPVVGGATIGTGQSAHAGIAELARSATSVRPRRDRPARVRARPLTEPMNARDFAGHTPIISGDVRTRLLPSSPFGPAAPQAGVGSPTLTTVLPMLAPVNNPLTADS